MQSNIGLIGLGTMGQNLALNIANKNFTVSVFNRTTETTEQFIKEQPHLNINATKTLKQLVSSLSKPRKIILLVKAGPAVDKVIANLIPLLEKDDLLIDLGNSNFKDTIKRHQHLKKYQIKFIGSGVSGGEKGALNGPSLMPGGNKKDYQLIKDIWEQISARDFQSLPCTTFFEGEGSGHFVKMTHNGIEYAIMQMISEIYDIFRKLYQLQPREISEIFHQYNQGPLKSFLFEITAESLSKIDEFTGEPLINKILDIAKQKGTGRWTAIYGLEYGLNLSIITQSVYSRVNSSERNLRLKLSETYPQKFQKPSIPLSEMITIVEKAALLTTILCYTEGLDLLNQVEQQKNWNIDLAETTRIWQGGCIIRAEILKTFHQIFKKDETLKSLLLAKEIQQTFHKNLPHLTNLCSTLTKHQIYTPVFNASLNYFLGITSEKTAANLIQELRDNFGSHTYQRTDLPGTFHSNW